MDFFKRIGTDRHKFKLEFFLKTLACNAKLKGEVYVKIKRGDHKLQSQKKVSLEEDGSCNFGRQILTFQSLTLFYDSTEKAYQQKLGDFSVIIITKKGDKKLLGQFQFDVAQYANSGKQNLQIKKQFGDKIKAVLQFDVFIKCLGEASQTSKSVDKPIQRKKQSSLSKFTSFFTGKNQGDQKQDHEDSQDSNKKVVNKKQIASSKKIDKQKQPEKPKKNKYDLQKNTKQSTSKQKKADIKFAGSQRKASQKVNKRKKDDSQQQQDNQQQVKQKPSRNLVNIKQKDNFTQVEQSQQIKVKPLKKASTPQPQQQPVFFDQPYINKKKNAIQDRDNDKDNSAEYQPKNNKIKRTENSNYTKQTNQPKQVPAPQKFSKKINQFQLKPPQNNPQLQKTVAELKDKNSSLQKQNKQLKTQNQKLSQQNRNLKLTVQSLKNSQNDDFYRTERQQPNAKKQDDQRVKALQKQKGQLLTKLQKQQQKYKKDFQKYQQHVQQYETQKTEQEQSFKAELKRMKEQFSQQKQKYDKLLSKYEEKVGDEKNIKQRENDLKEKLAAAQNALSTIKLKIGDKLNEANQDGNKSVIDILTLLSE